MVESYNAQSIGLLRPEWVFSPSTEHATIEMDQQCSYEMRKSARQQANLTTFVAASPTTELEKQRVQ